MVGLLRRLVLRRSPCKSDSTCGEDKCCVLGFCASKRGLNQSCNFVSLHRCGCKSGLTCQVRHSVGSLKWYYTCQPTPQPPTEPGSGDGGF
ncbi:hypothetical protein QZH41_013278 [Actinostola sp. cb2023]|nr:hypothetical protein QZH41_013278 [Actinostola sp. cb2023]